RSGHRGLASPGPGTYGTCGDVWTAGGVLFGTVWDRSAILGRLDRLPAFFLPLRWTCPLDRHHAAKHERRPALAGRPLPGRAGRDHDRFGVAGRGNAPGGTR